MPRYNEKRHTLQVIFTTTEYERLKKYAASSDKSMSAVIREFTEKGLDGELTEKNIDFITPIIRDQLKALLDVRVERLAALSAKTCIQAGTAAYLAAEALNSFVPAAQQRNFVEAYEAARKKAVQYTKSSGNIVDGVKE